MSGQDSGPGSTKPVVRGAVGRRATGLVEVFVADEQDAVAIDTDRWLRLAVEILAAEGVGEDVEMSLLFVDETSIAALNERFMGKDGPTDVLSFPIDEEATPSARMAVGANGPVDLMSEEDDDDDVPMMLGDVLICPAVAARNAPEHVSDRHDGSIDDELALLVVHGILHLVGMDHVDDTEAERMEAREHELLRQFHREPFGPVGEERTR